jgi:Transcriptional regulator
MDIRQLRYFLSVAEELHFGRAAERIHISQPPLSRQIMDLEEELGVKLFERTPKGVLLTPAGNYLKIEASRLISLSERVRERIGAIGQEATRHIRIGFVGSTLYSFIPELLAFLRGEMPGLAFELQELSSDEQAKALSTGKIDIGFLRSWLREPGIDFSPVTEESLSAVFSRSLPGLQAGASTLEQLEGQPFIAFSKGCAPGIAEVVERICDRNGFAARTIFVANQYDAVLRLVASGLGWSIAPTLAVKNSRLGLESFELTDLPERIVVGVARLEGDCDPTVKALVEIIREYFAAG